MTRGVRHAAALLDEQWWWGALTCGTASAALALAATLVSASKPPRSTVLALACVSASAGAAATLALLAPTRRSDATMAAIDRLLPPPSPSTRGTITLVGAGPGAPELLTLAGFAALQRADVVICDHIAPRALRDLAPVHAEFRVADKLPGGAPADAAQAELNAWGLDALMRGCAVVRLKVGDPFLFGRGGEEVIFYSAHGFPPTVIPGVCTALAAPLHAGIPVTHRGSANSVLISTGRARGGACPEVPPFDSSRTLVLLMAVGRAPVLAQDLCGEGGPAYPTTTPVAVIERSYHPDERVTRTTLGGLAAAAAQLAFESPAVLVIGSVVNALRDSNEK